MFNKLTAFIKRAVKGLVFVITKILDFIISYKLDPLDKGINMINGIMDTIREIVDALSISHTRRVLGTIIIGIGGGLMLSSGDIKLPKFSINRISLCIGLTMGVLSIPIVLMSCDENVKEVL